MKHFFSFIRYSITDRHSRKGHKVPRRNLLKKILMVFCSVGLVLAVLVVSFGSCSPNQTNQDSTAGNNNNDGAADDDEESSRRRSSSSNDDPEDCDDDEGDPCRDDEDCEAACAHIYAGRTSSITSCKNRGDETVGRLEEIHDILMGRKAGLTKANGAEVREDSDVESDLAKIKDEDEDIGHDDLKCYLQIGSHKYIDEIEKGLRPTDATPGQKKRANLIATLKWLVEDDEESAEVIADLNAGDRILEALLLALSGQGSDGPTNAGTKDCIEGTEYVEDNSLNNRNQQHDIWWLNSGDSMGIRVYKNNTGATETITFGSSEDKTLYNAVSCFHSEISEQNIFSYSAEEENEHIFDLAFSLLKSVCDDVTSKSAGQDKACNRALMCWTSWQDNCVTRGGNCTSDPDDNDKLWTERLSDHESDLEQSGSSDYKKCSTSDFADYFPG